MASGDFAGAVAADFNAIAAIGEALAGSGKPFVTTSGTLMLTFGGIAGRPGTEQDVLPGGPRVDAENYVDRTRRTGVSAHPWCASRRRCTATWTCTASSRR